MEMFIKSFVLIVQLGLAGFVIWGGLLCARAWLQQQREARKPSPTLAPVAPSPANFERTASLVLLALLCTTLAAIA
jgi:hypothetical protein